MNAQEPFDPLCRFAGIERLVSKIYFRFSHLFLQHTELRDFWWEMASEEEQARASCSKDLSVFNSRRAPTEGFLKIYP